MNSIRWTVANRRLFPFTNDRNGSKAAFGRRLNSSRPVDAGQKRRFSSKVFKTVLQVPNPCGSDEKSIENDDETATLQAAYR